MRIPAEFFSLSFRTVEMPPVDRHKSNQSDAPVRNDELHESVPQPRAIQSDELLRGDREILIVHHNEVYRLRETRNGKLILGK